MDNLCADVGLEASEEREGTVDIVESEVAVESQSVRKAERMNGQLSMTLVEKSQIRPSSHHQHYQRILQERNKKMPGMRVK